MLITLRASAVDPSPTLKSLLPTNLKFSVELFQDQQMALCSVPKLVKTYATQKSKSCGDNELCTLSRNQINQDNFLNGNVNPRNVHSLVQAFEKFICIVKFLCHISILKFSLEKPALNLCLGCVTFLLMLEAFDDS